MHEKIINALISAKNHLEKSMEALVNKDEEGLLGSVWVASSDIEYVIFLLSLTRPDEFGNPSRKPGLSSKQGEIGPMLVLAQDLVEEAKSSIDVGDLREAEKKAGVALDCLIKLRETFEKKRKAGEKSTPPQT